MASTCLTIFITVALAIDNSLCTVAGISYMDPLNFKPLPDIPGSDPCNPLYWYPKHIPEYCYIHSTPKSNQPALEPIEPIPIPVPMPAPVPLPPAPILPAPPLPPVPLPMPSMWPPPPIPFPPVAPVPIPPIPLPYGLPLAPSHPMLPVSGIPPLPYPGFYPPPRPQIGMVPGIPGIVSPDGGINILPFSDVYSNMLEKHKNKMLRKRLRKVIEDYDEYPRRFFRRYKKHRRRSG